MKSLLLYSVLLLGTIGQLTGQITAPGVKWSDSYTFDRFNQMKIDFFAKDGKLMRTLHYKTFYNADAIGLKSAAGELQVPEGNFCVLMDAPGKGSDTETIFDMTHSVAIQIFGCDSPEPMYNAGGFKFPVGADIKRLDLVPTEETRTIAGHLCKKYTYTYKKIFGSVWITSEIKLPNDFGLFRAAKMAALHNTLSSGGFVMEMTSEDANGGKTVMTTVSLGNQENQTITLPKGKINTAINKVNYFTF